MTITDREGHEMIETKQENEKPVIGAGLAEELAKILGVDPESLRPRG